MSTRTLLNLGLALLALGLVLVAVYRPGLEPEPEPQAIVSGIVPGDVVGITVERTAQSQLTFSRRDDHWFLFDGTRELPAAEFQLNALLRLLEARSEARYAAADLDLAELELEPPQVTIRFDETAVRLGGRGALGDLRYAQVGDDVFLVADQYRHLLTAEDAGFVDRRLLVGRGDLTRLELPDLVLERSADGWQVEPGDSGASADDLQRFVDQWQNASALHVSRWDGGEGEARVTLHTDGQADPLVLAVLSRSPDLVLGRADWGIRYHLAGNLAESLFTLPEPAAETPPATDGEGEAAAQPAPGGAAAE